ncbi:Uncharacterised protein [Vibrio cholerae]|uniref:Uncharacterized protein n=1 Tax=Vibrio cholerae TaxID=666 RepID=A0A655Y0G1_VIBCL|nr:Uncharacterised protein [Vibrio cholerae]CSC25210.1 Uncharacterised protein [Vibrio cholerae]CSI52143.1 Uncharacterised protein [Vibrio cholerae]
MVAHTIDCAGGRGHKFICVLDSGAQQLDAHSSRL